LRGKLSKALASEAAEAQAGQERQQAETRKQAIEGLKERKAQLEADWRALVGEFEAIADRLPAMWQRYDQLQGEIQTWERETQGMGLGAIEKGQSDVFRRMQRPHSLLTFEPWGR